MDIKQFIRIKLETTHQQEIKQAHELALMLDLPEPSADVSTIPFYLSFIDGRLQITENNEKKTRQTRILVDFLSGTSQFRYKNDRKINQPLLKSAGLKRGFRPDICDVTAGYGIDSFVFASFDCPVTMIERSPVIYLLLRDGLKRLADDTRFCSLAANYLSLYQGDAKDLLCRLDKKFHTIYMDPMYPAGKKSALNKLPMRILRSLVGDDCDSNKLLEIATKYAENRVVVKRPSAAEGVGTMSPSFSVAGKSCRYDVYLTDHL